MRREAGRCSTETAYPIFGISACLHVHLNQRNINGYNKVIYSDANKKPQRLEISAKGIQIAEDIFSPTLWTTWQHGAGAGHTLIDPIGTEWALM